MMLKTMNNEKMKRAWAEISLVSLHHNYKAIKANIPDSCKFLGVVKADAYGHGAIAVANFLESEGVDYLAVSCLDEAIELRNGGIKIPILILGHTPPEFTKSLIEHELTQTISCLAKAEEYSREAEKCGRPLTAHIKIDSGMSRLGFVCTGTHRSQGIRNIICACNLPGINAEGIYTHFSVSEGTDKASVEYTFAQFRLFCSIFESVESALGKRFILRHCANSGAVVNYPEMALDMVRPGLLLYGYGDTKGKFKLEPAMSLFARISTIKIIDPGTAVSYGRHYISDDHIRLGVLSIGYADGIPRLISNKCEFAAGKHFTKQIGSVCMDMCMVNLTNMPDIAVGDPVEIFGKTNSIYKLSDAAQTIPYEILCAVSKRIPRIYK